MAFSNVGGLTSLAEGQSVVWNYSYGGDHGVQIASADIKTPNFGAVLLATNQEKRILNDGTTTYFVTITNLGPGPVFHNLQGGGVV